MPTSPENSAEIIQTLCRNHTEYEIEYKRKMDGPQERRRHTCTYYMGEDVMGEGTGSSKPDAKNAAAKEAWQWLYSRKYVS